MFFYQYFAGRGREALADTFDAADPFGLPPAEILEPLLGLGCVPDVTLPRLTMWPTIGRVFEVRREQQDFLVAIGRDAEEISVQEMRADRIYRSNERSPRQTPATWTSTDHRLPEGPGRYPLRRRLRQLRFRLVTVLDTRLQTEYSDIRL